MHRRIRDRREDPQSVVLTGPNGGLNRTPLRPLEALPSREETPEQHADYMAARSAKYRHLVKVLIQQSEELERRREKYGRAIKALADAESELERARLTLLELRRERATPEERYTGQERATG